MARKKTDGLTARQRQSQQIMREKAAKKRRKAIMRKVQIGAGAFCAVTFLVGSVWGVKSGFVADTVQAASDRFYAMTARSGFAVQALYLEGRNRTPMADIEKALGIKKGDPILRLSLDEARARLEQIDSVHFAAVERSLPGALYVRISEREPVALWQNNGKISLVDEKGAVMTGLDVTPYKHLPLIVGSDAPAHVTELMEILSQDEALAKRFTAAIRVGERRWNIRIDGNVEVKLPEEGPAEAWKRLAQMQSDQHLLDRSIKVIDLRLPDRLFIKLTPDVITDKKSANARET